MSFDDLASQSIQRFDDNPLKTLALKYDTTDKETQHKYCDFYHSHLKDLRYKIKEVLEVGVWMGGSAKMWRDYFPNAMITGLDIEDKKWCETERIKTYICDQSDILQLMNIVQDKKYDLIIDDGSHRLKHQQITLSFLFFSVVKGGIYILEDLHTSFIPYYRDPDCDITTYDLLQQLKAGNIPKSNYILQNTMEKIASMIDSMEFYQRDPTNMQDSITCVIKLKN